MISIDFMMRLVVKSQGLRWHSVSLSHGLPSFLILTYSILHGVVLRIRPRDLDGEAGVLRFRDDV